MSLYYWDPARFTMRELKLAKIQRIIMRIERTIKITKIIMTMMMRKLLF